MKLYATCGHEFILPGVSHPDSVKCSVCNRTVAVWAVDLKGEWAKPDRAGVK